MNSRDPLDGIEDDKKEWLEALENVFENYGDQGVSFLLRSLSDWHDKNSSISPTKNLNTPYLNSIKVSEQPNYPGDLELEKRLENILRWNAMAMVLQGQDNGSGVGGHIATYASAATLMEVGFNHFFRKQSESYGGDLIIPQPHTSPGIYARSFIEGVLSEAQLKNFRRELKK